MKKPIIGITGSCLFETSAGLFSGYERIYTNADYVNAVIKAGGIPLILPVLEKDTAKHMTQADIVKEYTDIVDGLIIMGGYDVDPAFFNEEPLSILGQTLPKRDVCEIALIQQMTKAGKPMFGICRGLQILNVAFGGSLYQDLSLIKRDMQIQHVQKSHPTVRTHSIHTEKNSVMQKIFGKEDKVNSFHHMAIKDVAKDFKTTALAPDGIIEAIEYTKDLYIIGVQFHPEMTAATHKASQKLFDEFVIQCNK